MLSRRTLMPRVRRVPQLLLRQCILRRSNHVCACAGKWLRDGRCLPRVGAGLLAHEQLRPKWVVMWPVMKGRSSCAGQAEDKPAPAAKQDTIPDDELESELEAGGIVSKEPVPVSNPYEALEGAAETAGAEASE